jgi:hypothetical protein
VAPAASVAAVQLTVPPLSLHVPGAVAKVVPAGNVSVMRTFVATLGPRFCTLTT